MYRSIVKTILDKIVAISAIILLLPIFIIICVILYLEFDGPIIHKRIALGKDKKKFKFFKFRTMRSNADILLNEWKLNNLDLFNEYSKNTKLIDDPRVTRFGSFLRKISIDEIPQFFNVIFGDMSLVGPRPIVEDELTKYSNEAIMKRFSVKPGITGYWQVNGRQEVDYSDRSILDTYYIDNISFILDLRIIFKTFKIIVTRKGAF